MRGPGCCLGSCLGLVLGALLALGLVVALARWAPVRFENAVRWAAGTEAPIGAATAPHADQRTVQPDEEVLRRQARRRLRRACQSSRKGGALMRTVEFAPQEVQAAASDPEGPFGGRPRGLRVELLEERVRLSWKVSLFDSPQWLSSALGVPMSMTLEPRVEKGRILLPVRAGRAVGVPLPELVARWLVPDLPAAPPLESLGREALLPGLGRIEVHPQRLVLHPADSGGD